MGNRGFGYEELAGLMRSKAGVSVDPAVLEGSPDVEFAQYGLDSLGLLGLVAELEQTYGVELGGGAVASRTPREFVETVGASLRTVG
ncbi:phosphopantetheine-binding protein [Streptomyces sp. NPDC048604]|uniref:phosphopantetheine-binding protein n=1 Tax=Streptomyces sp. NPDC048604 TaxID=3365578 RepID=UPI0037141E49